MRHPGLIILAAGGSSRMGEPKQLLPWGESTLLRHACVTALATGCWPVVLVLGHAADHCRASCEGLPLMIVENGHWAQGLGSSLATGMKSMLATEPGLSGVLVMLADQPAVTSALLERLITAWDPAVRPIAAMAYGEVGGVPAVFDRAYFGELLALREDRGARALIDREKRHVALVDGGESLIDVDTPSAYRAHRPHSSHSIAAEHGDFTN